MYLAKERKQSMKKFFNEFKTFISRGNVVDLAVGIIIGSAFTAIVNALVNSIFMPLIGACTGGNLDNLVTFLWTTKVSANQVDPGETATLFNGVYYDNLAYIDWGAFLEAVINFFLIALVLFTIVKVINSIREGAKKAEAKIKEHANDDKGVTKVKEAPKDDKK